MFSRSIVVLVALATLVTLFVTCYAASSESDDEVESFYHLDLEASTALRVVNWGLSEDLEFSSIEDATIFVRYCNKLERYVSAPEGNFRDTGLIEEMSELLVDSRVQLVNKLLTSDVSRFSVLDSPLNSGTKKRAHGSDRYAGEEGPYARFALLKRKLDRSVPLSSVLSFFYRLKQDDITETLLEDAAGQVHQNMLLLESTGSKKKGCSMKVLEPICQLLDKELRRKYYGAQELAELAELRPKELQRLCKHNGVDYQRIRQTCASIGSRLSPMTLVRDYELLDIFEDDQLEQRLEEDEEFGFYHSLARLCRVHSN